MAHYSVVYICPGSGSRRTETFSNCVVRIEGNCLVVYQIKEPNPRHIQPNGPALSVVMMLADRQWFSVKELPPSVIEVDDRSVNELDLSVRVANSLDNAGITTIGQLENATRDAAACNELRKIGFTAKMLQQIHEELTKLSPKRCTPQWGSCVLDSGHSGQHSQTRRDR